MRTYLRTVRVAPAAGWSSRCRWLLVLAAVAGTVPVHATDGSFTGYAHSLDTGKLLYVEFHAVTGANTAAESRVVLYRCSEQGAAFARKELSYGSQRLAPAFSMQDARSGFAEGLTRDARGLTVFASEKTGAPPRREPLPNLANLVADAGFDEFVRTNWETLERGRAVVAPFLVPSRLSSLDFKVRKLRDTRLHGQPASVIRLSLAGPIGWFLSDIEVVYRKADRRLLRYRGVTNIRDPGGHPLHAQIDFPDAGRSATVPDLASLRAEPLTRRCD